MVDMNWKDSYSVKVLEMDKEHRALLAIGQELVALADGPEYADYYDDLLKVLWKLRDYTIFHFESEEKMLEVNQVPGRDEHIVEHRFFIRKIDRISRKDLDSMQREAIQELLAFVADWVVGHILKTDMQYHPHVRTDAAS